MVLPQPASASSGVKAPEAISQARLSKPVNSGANAPVIKSTTANNKTPSVINALIFGATFGYLWLSTVPPTSGIVSHIFGTKYVSLLYGFVFLSHQVGSFLGAYLGGLFHDLYGSLDYAWYISIALSLFAGLIHLPIKEKAIERPQLA